jgi:DNA-binding NarL/FixJ family response regulator
VVPATAATPTPTDRLGLTERETEILELLAQGLTNRQIGERLFISPKTAGVHVSNILGKLEVPSRIQAATLAHRLGMGQDPAPEP